ncbi:hypothetical protein D3C73_1313800 [compost metagenome]
MGRDEVFLRVLRLGDRELAALYAVISDLGPRVVLLSQARLVDDGGGGVRVVDLRAVDLLERLHSADRADELQVGVVVKQVAAEIEGQRRYAAAWHEVADLQPHLCEVRVRQRELVLLVLDAQDGVTVLRSPVRLAR